MPKKYDILGKTFIYQKIWIFTLALIAGRVLIDLLPLLQMNFYFQLIFLDLIVIIIISFWKIILVRKTKKCIKNAKY